MNHADLIDRLGGARAVAEALGQKENTVSHWKQRRIPPLYWNDIVRLAHQMDDLKATVSIDGLKEHAIGQAA